MDARGEWDGEHGIGTFVTIPGVKRDDRHGTSSLLRWVDVELREPDLAPQRSLKGWQSGTFLFGDLHRCELAPLSMLL
jgi:hypothetical protein